MSGSFGNAIFGNPTVQNGMGVNSANNAIELGGDLVRPTIINTDAVNALKLTGIQAGDPVTDVLAVLAPDGTVKFLAVVSIPDFWRSGTGATLPDGATDTTDAIIHNGNVGVGLADPTTIRGKVHVNGANANGAGTPLFKLTDTNIANSYFAVDNGGAANAYRIIASLTNLELQSAGNGNQLVLSTNGGVGVGTNVPTAGVGNLSVAVNGLKPGGGAWGAFSDKRVKKSIKEFSYGLAQLLKLKPISFQYNGKAGTLNDGKTYYSLIAQEVQEVLPDFVEEHPIDDETYAEMSTKDRKLFEDKTVLGLKEGLTNFEAILIRAVQELAEQNRKLESRVAALEGNYQDHA